MFRRLILCLLVLWLPLQGSATQTMLFCHHDPGRLQEMAGAPASGAVGASASSQQLRFRIGVPPQGRRSHAIGFKCSSCGACQLACGAALPTAPVNTPILLAAAAPALLSPLAPPSVVLDRPNPPPLLRA